MSNNREGFLRMLAEIDDSVSVRAHDGDVAIRFPNDFYATYGAINGDPTIFSPVMNMLKDHATDATERLRAAGVNEVGGPPDRNDPLIGDKLVVTNAMRNVMFIAVMAYKIALISEEVALDKVDTIHFDSEEDRASFLRNVREQREHAEEVKRNLVNMVTSA